MRGHTTRTGGACALALSALAGLAFADETPQAGAGGMAPTVADPEVQGPKKPADPQAQEPRKPADPPALPSSSINTTATPSPT